MDLAELQQQDSHGRELARWTHMWASAAVLVLGQIDGTYDPEGPVGSLGKRDVLALVVLDAVRNTYRGARAFLGNDHASVSGFEQSASGMKELRDRFEHFDEYLRGEGLAQRSGRRGPGLDLQGLPGLEITGSRGGGHGGHTIDVKVREAEGDIHYTLMTQTVVDAARVLARDTIDRAGLLDEQHVARCSKCGDASMA